MGATIPGSFANTVAVEGNEVALRSGQGERRSEWTWDAYAEAACRVAASLQSLGIRRDDRVALMMRNRPEFHIADMGVLLAGGTPLSIYNSSPPDRIAYVANHSDARIAIVEDLFLDRFTAARPGCPTLRTVVSVGAGGDVTFDSLDAAPLDLETAAGEVGEDDLATVIYTSGTTGEPKGVMLDHANLGFALEAYGTVLGQSLRGLRQVSYLPMAHIAERVATHYFHCSQGSVVTCCPDLADLARIMAAVQPEWFFSAPRLWEKLRAAIESLVAKRPSDADGFARARRVGWQVFLASRDQGAVPAPLEKEWHELHRDYVRPVLELVGLAGVVIAITGAAPVPPHTSEFFLSLGVPLSEVWAMSETTGTGTWSPHHIVPGTAGRPAPGLEFRLADDHEILVRGPCVFRGYLNDPARTAEVLDGDGWLHTGDIGHFDADRNLSIVDRIKEIIVPSSGHNVSPAQLEGLLKDCTLVGQACVVGDGRPHVAALLVLDPDRARMWARSRGHQDASLPALAHHPEVRAEIAAFVENVNDRVPKAERVVAFAVLSDEWLPDSDLLTPTAKLKRRGITERYAAAIAELYEEA